jgi:hypothetical protein
MKYTRTSRLPTGRDMLARYLHGHPVAAASGEKLFGQASKVWRASPHGQTRLRTNRAP